MKEINEINMSRMNNGAHFTYMSDILNRAKNDTKVKNKTVTQIAALEAALADENANLKLSRKSLLTDDIAEADAQRDALYSGYKKAVEGFLNMPVEAMAKAAKELNQHIIDYQIDTKAQMDKETGMLVNFIEDLEKKYNEQVAALALTPFVTSLKAANERLRTLTEQRTDERTGITVGATTKARKATDDAYRMLVKWVNALTLVEGEEGYANFIDYVNTQIVHYKREVLHQKSTAPSTSGDGGNEGDGSDEGDEGNDDGESPDPIV